MSNVAGEKFNNGPTCKGVSFSEPNAPFDLSHIEVENRYPAGRNDWSVFEDERFVQVYVIEGTGSLLKKDSGSVELESGKSYKIEGGTRYAWKSSGGRALRFIMGVSPPFGDGKGYKVEVEQ